MNSNTVNLMWLTFMLMQPDWYHILGFYFFVDTAAYVDLHIPKVLNAVCDHPIISSTYPCHMAASHRHAIEHAHAVDAGFKSFEELFLASSLTTGLQDAQLSIDDVVFLLKTSMEDCHGQMPDEFNALQMDSVDVDDGLVGFRTEALSVIDLVIRASEDLFDILIGDTTPTFHRYFYFIIKSPFRLRTCATSTLIPAFGSNIDNLESTITHLLSQADILDGGLNRLEGHLQTIRTVFSDEAGAIIPARDIAESPKSMLGWHRSRLHCYATPFQTIQSISSYRNAASMYVANVRGRLRSVATELAALKALSRDFDHANVVTPVEMLTHALRAGILRLRGAQIALSGLSSGAHAGMSHSSGAASD